MKLTPRFHSRSLGGYDVLDLDTPEARRVAEITWEYGKGYRGWSLDGELLSDWDADRDAVVDRIGQWLWDSGWRTRSHLDETKVCVMCGEEKPKADFPARALSWDGRDSQCRYCYGASSGVTWQARRDQAELDAQMRAAIRED